MTSRRHYSQNRIEISPKSLQSSRTMGHHSGLSFWEDLTVKELIPVKIMMFLQSAGDMALYPFLTLHMISLGISVSEIGIQFALTPIATLIATPLVGIIADKMGDFKKVLAITLIMSAIMSNFLLMVPKIQKVSTCLLNHEVIDISCPQQAEGIFNLSQELLSSDDPVVIDVPSCFNFTSFGSPKTTNSSSVNTTDLELELEQKNLVYLSDCYIDCFPKRSSRIRKYCLSIKRSIKPELLNETMLDDVCFTFDTNMTRRFTVSLTIDRNQLEHNKNSTHIKTINSGLHEVILDYQIYQKFVCRTSECSIKCPVQETTRFSNSSQHIMTKDPVSHRFTFWSYLVIRILLIVVIATEMTLLKAAILMIVESNKSEYGFQRLWSVVANCIIPPITGIAMDKLKAHSSTGADIFYPCFYVYSAFKIIMAIVSLIVDLKMKNPSCSNMVKAVDTFTQQRDTNSIDCSYLCWLHLGLHRDFHCLVPTGTECQPNHDRDLFHHFCSGRNTVHDLCWMAGQEVWPCQDHHRWNLLLLYPTLGILICYEFISCLGLGITGRDHQQPDDCNHNDLFNSLVISGSHCNHAGDMGSLALCRRSSHRLRYRRCGHGDPWIPGHLSTVCGNHIHCRHNVYNRVHKIHQTKGRTKETEFNHGQLWHDGTSWSRCPQD